MSRLWSGRGAFSALSRAFDVGFVSTIASEDPRGLLPDHVYDILKWVAIIVMPALATFIVGIGGIWSIPYTGQVASTVTAVGVLLGALLGLSSVKYHGQ